MSGTEGACVCEPSGRISCPINPPTCVMGLVWEEEREQVLDEGMGRARGEEHGPVHRDRRATCSTVLLLHVTP